MTHHLFSTVPTSRTPSGIRGRRRARPVPDVAGQGASASPRAGGVAVRLLDVVLATALLLLLAPLLLVIAVLVRTTSDGPVLFRQTRLGYRQRPFVMFKFRTMYAGCDDAAHRDYVSRMLRGEDPREPDNGAVYKINRDCRITGVGGVLRSTSLDELPQLINVLRGEMSLVGPRPPLDWEVLLYRPHHHERFAVKPGITGLWQVSGRNRLTMNEALELDVDYVRRRSLALDLWILMKTVPAVIELGSTR